MNKLSKKAKERREKSLQFTGGKRNGNSSWSEDLLNLHMNNDRCLYDYVKKQKKLTEDEERCKDYRFKT